MSTAFRVARLLLLALILAPSSARAAVDQYNPWAPQQPTPITVFPGWIGKNGALPEWEVAQTFTVGLSGPLSEVRVWVSKVFVGAPLTIEIRPLVGGVPGADASSALASASIIDRWVPWGANGGNWVDANFGAAAPEVIAGQQLAIVVRSSAPALYGAGSKVHDLYTGGNAFRRQGATAAWEQMCVVAGGGCATALNRADLFFKTYVGDVTDPPTGYPAPLAPALSPTAQGVVVLLLAGTAIAFMRFRRTSRPA